MIEPAAGLTNPLSTLKNVVLPAPFGPIRPHVPPGKTTRHVVDRRDAAEADGEVLDLDHGAFFSAGACSRHAGGDQPPELRQVLRHLVDEAAGRGQQHLEQPDAEEDEQEVRVDAPLRLEEERAAAG